VISSSVFTLKRRLHELPRDPKIVGK